MYVSKKVYHWVQRDHTVKSVTMRRVQACKVEKFSATVEFRVVSHITKGGGVELSSAARNVRIYEIVINAAWHSKNPININPATKVVGLHSMINTLPHLTSFKLVSTYKPVAWLSVSPVFVGVVVVVRTVPVTDPEVLTDVVSPTEVLLGAAEEVSMAT